MFLQSSLSTKIDLLDDSDEEKKPRKLATNLCAGWRISLRKTRKANILRQKNNWVGKHIEELAVQGPEAFQKMNGMW